MVAGKLTKAVVEYMKDEDVSELKRYKKEFSSEPDYNWYQYGNILPYTNQIIEFFEEAGVDVPKSVGELVSRFMRSVGKAIDIIIEEDSHA